MFILARILLDTFIISFSYMVSYLAKFNLLSTQGILSFPFNQYATYLVSIIIIYLVAFYLLNMYKPKKGFLLYIDEFLGVFSAVSLAWAFLIVITFIRGEYEFSRPIILLSLPITLFLVLVEREIILRMEILARSKGFGSKRATIIGTGELAQAVAQKINAHPSYGVHFIGFIGDKNENVLGTINDLESIVKKHNIQILYIADKSYKNDQLVDLAAFCDEKDLKLGTIPDVFQILTTSPSVEDIEGLPIVSLKHTHFTPFNRFMKRTFDLLLVLFGIIVFSIPMVIVSILIKITSPGGSAIYSQERVGRKNEVFKLYKFRTMIPEAEKHTGPVLATEDDPRKTLIGKFLRASKLDELPQLFNILKGDMSFVGPRPERPAFVEEFKQLIPKYMERHRIRPGIAGWAQLHGGYNMPAEEKIKYDLYYIENWSFLLDLKIILKCIHIAFTFQRRN